MFNKLNTELYVLFHFPLMARWLHFRFKVIHVVTMLFRTDWLFELHRKWCFASIEYLEKMDARMNAELLYESLLGIKQDEHDAELAEEEETTTFSIKGE